MTREIVQNDDPQVVRVFIIRHGRTDWNKKKILQGHIDVDMNDEGKQQAEKAADHFKSISLDDIVSSDLIRCTGTAKAILRFQQNTSYSETADLRERNMGKVQGMPLSEALERYGVGFRNLGEPESSLLARVGEVFDSRLKRAALHGHHNIMLCTHGGVIGAFVSHLFRERKYSLAAGHTEEDLRVPSNTAVTVIDWNKQTGSGTIMKCGVTEHLGSEIQVENQLLR